MCFLQTREKRKIQQESKDRDILFYCFYHYLNYLLAYNRMKENTRYNKSVNVIMMRAGAGVERWHIIIINIKEKKKTVKQLPFSDTVRQMTNKI